MIIYLCAFIHTHYIEEAKICIESIRTRGKFTGDIYLFTDMDVCIDGVHIIKTTVDNVFLSASYRTRIFEHIPLNDIPPGEIILYLDTDIVVLDELPRFDDINHKIQMYGYPNESQKDPPYAGFITDDEYYTTHTAVCSGILLFKPSIMVKQVFDDTYNLYKQLVNNNKINDSWEKPALCYTLIKHDMFEISLDDIVYEERSKQLIPSRCIFNHFCCMRGTDRHVAMQKYL